MDPVTLRIVGELPEGFLNARPEDLHELLGGPTLIHLDGQVPEPLFVSILLHGNEHSGLFAVQQLLQRYRNTTLPRALSILVGNVAAVAANRRTLPGQADYNRIWGIGDTPEHRLTHQVLEELRARRVFAAIDIHNNTGVNPHYALVCRLENAHFHLATLFGRTVVYARKPDTTCTWAFSELCPAITLECGLSGEAHGIAHATELIEACLRLSHFPDQPVARHDMDLFHTVAIVKIPDHFSFSFTDADADIVFDATLISHNFTELPRGSRFCRIHRDSYAELEAWDEHGRNRADHYFHHDGDHWTLRMPVMPAMLTSDSDVIRLDCLCYLMERLDWQGATRPGEDDGWQQAQTS